MRFLFLVGSILFALTAPKLGSLKYYLRANLAYLFGTEFFLLVAGVESLLYAIFYTVFTGIVLLSAIAVSWRRAVRGKGLIWLAGLAGGVFFAVVTRSGLQYGTSLGKAINTIEGATMMALAVVMGLVWISATYNRLPNVLIPKTLLVYWLAIGTYRLGWTLHDGVLWDKLNWFIPSFLTSATMLWLGWRLRLQARTESVRGQA